MKITIDHRLTFTWDQPARTLLHLHRLTPRNHEGQHVVRWRLETDIDAHLRSDIDAFGNIVHTLEAGAPVSELTVCAIGEVHTNDMAGIVRGAIEPFPPALFMRETGLTALDAAISDFAEGVLAGLPETERGPLDRAHALMGAIHKTVACDEALPVVGAGTAFIARRATPADLAHLFIAAARHLGLPARCVCGYEVPETIGDQPDGRPRSWAEAHIDGYGWIAFDARTDFCPTDTHVRVATGLDYWGAAPLRSSKPTTPSETLAVVGHVIVHQ